MVLLRPRNGQERHQGRQERTDKPDARRYIQGTNAYRVPPRTDESHRADYQAVQEREPDAVERQDAFRKDTLRFGGRETRGVHAYNYFNPPTRSR